MKTDEKAKPGSVRLVAGKVMYFLRLTKAAINRIIIGANASKEFEWEVRNAAAHSDFPAERIIRAELDHANLVVTIPD